MSDSHDENTAFPVFVGLWYSSCKKVGLAKRVAATEGSDSCYALRP